MPFSSRSYVNRYTPSNRFPTGVKWLLIVNIALFLPYYVLQQQNSLHLLLDNFALVPAQAVGKFAIWQIATYMFLHNSIMDVVWNMLALWMFGSELERTWGTNKFLRFYFACGIIAALTVVVAAFLFHASGILTVGSSGAVYGLLAAYAVLFPDQTMLFGFLIPMKSKYFVMIIGAIVFLQSYMATMGGQGSAIGVTALLGGMVGGYLLLRGRKLKIQIRQPIMDGYKDWKLRRAKKKFQVYLKKRDSGPDRWVH
ncbi:MAG TPA: rhomboid family intramembrane serine protease [Bryobacteraceae bacterium]|nr:rhomboid family intramembrane serine protease [Bryobacteraceae bacterium]